MSLLTYRAASASLALLSLVAPVLGCSSTPSRGSELGPPGLDDGSVADGTASDAEPASDAGSVTPHDSGANVDAATDAGDAGSGSIDGAASDDASDAGDASAEAAPVTGPPPPPSICSRTANWGAGTKLDISTSADDVLDAITPDELSIVWTSGTGGSKVVLYADRASASDAFAAPQMLATGQFTADRVAISADGLRLVVVNADAQGFSELTRSSRMPAAPDASNLPDASTTTFGSPAAGSYSNYDMAGVLSGGQSFGDPVLSSDDTVFFYSIYPALGADAGQPTTVFRAARLLPTDQWPFGSFMPESTALDPQGSLRRRPNALSSDGQTLFYWDEVSGTEKAAWIDAKNNGMFDMAIDLGSRQNAAPSSACTHLYYSAQGATSIDLFMATSQ